MSSTPLVSVVIPSYKAAAYVGQLCRTLQDQTYGNFEALIGDDGSQDGTESVVAPFLSDPRFRFFAWNPNRGFGRATLTLLHQAKGEFWCHPGADDLLHPDFIAERTAILSSHPSAVLAHGPPIHIDPNGIAFSPENGTLLPDNFTQGPSLEQLLQHNLINNPGIMARMSVTRMVLPFISPTLRYAFDWFIWFLLASTGQDFVRDPVPRYCYRVHPTSLTCDPKWASYRQAETRLVPLCALAAASRFSPDAALLWSRWRQPLYVLWLTRAAHLSRRELLRDEWLQLGAQAYYSNAHNRVSLAWELARHAPSVARYFMAEQLMVRRQAFRVSGLALVNDPLFFKPSSKLTPIRPV